MTRMSEALRRAEISATPCSSARSIPTTTMSTGISASMRSALGLVGHRTQHLEPRSPAKGQQQALRQSEAVVHDEDP